MQRAPRPSRNPGCNVLTRTKDPYCPQHKQQSGWYQYSRESRHKRGYGTKWDKLRKAILKRDNHLCQCQDCKQRNLLTRATEVDHIIPKSRGGTDHPDNLQAINKDCHKRKTQVESRGKDYTSIGHNEDGSPNDPDHHWNQ